MKKDARIIAIILTSVTCAVHAAIDVEMKAIYSASGGIVVVPPGYVEQPMFYIGKYEITNEQYVEFLNAVAQTDTFGLFNSKMSESEHGGILQSGVSGSFTYSCKTHFENKPVNFVSLWDATRFANWMTNGQPTGAQDNTTTETGVYLLNGVLHPTVSAPIRNSAAYHSGGVAITSAGEWSESAYGETSAVFVDWIYPTNSSYAPTATTPNVDQPNSANYSNAVGTVTDIGAYPSPSPRGTYDQAGNVSEWSDTVTITESPVFDSNGWQWGGSLIVWSGPQGGSFESSAAAFKNADSIGFNLQSTTTSQPTEETATVGFRISSKLPLSETPETDADSDRLEDRYETNTGVYVSTTDTGTDPNAQDTGQDGLRDGFEVNVIGTNPLISDSDGDGLNDGDEVIIYLTNPAKVDTDNDELNDTLEIAATTFGFDPNEDSSELYQQFKLIVAKMPGMLTQEQKSGLTLGGTKLTPKSATSLQLDFVIETSPDMSNWTPIETVSETISISGDKSFVRVRATETE